MYDKFVWAQSYVQATLEPSRLWRASNSKKLKFEVVARPEVVTQALTQAIHGLDRDPNPFTGNPMRWKLHKHRPGKQVEALILTPYWLDKATFDVHPVGSDKCIVNAFARSTGVLPVVIPLSFILNAAFFFIPFTDALGKMSRHLIRRVMEKSQLKSNNL